MKIFLICSKKNYGVVPKYKDSLESRGHTVFLPNCMSDPNSEYKSKVNGNHTEFKQAMYRQSDEIIEQMDAVLVINPPKNDIPGYIGGATFLEMYDAFRHGKKIFAIEKIVQPVFSDETDGFEYTVISSLDDVK